MKAGIGIASFRRQNLVERVFCEKLNDWPKVA